MIFSQSILNINNHVIKNKLPSIESAGLTFYNDKDYKKTKYEKGLLSISKDYKRIWLINNFSEEDNYAIEYFQQNLEWEANAVEKFPNNRLWLLTKRD